MRIPTLFGAGGAPANADTSTAENAANHFPLATSQRTEREAKVYTALDETQLVERNRVAQLVEEALGHLLRLAGQAAHLAEQCLLLRVQVLRDDHLDDDVLVAAPAAAHVRHASALQPEGLPVLRAGGEGELDSPPPGRGLQPVPPGPPTPVHPHAPEPTPGRPRP